VKKERLTGQIDYQIEKQHFTEATEPRRLTRQIAIIREAAERFSMQRWPYPARSFPGTAAPAISTAC
jgi:hypothetical protein